MMARAADIFIRIYGLTLSPLLRALGAGCRFHPTCSEYARQAFATHAPSRAVQLTLARLFKCGPWHPGGLDPVPK